MLNTWYLIFKDDPYQVVELAALKLIESETSGFPNAAMLRKKIDELKAVANGEPTDEELWLMLRKATENAIYGAREEYEKLPDILKRYVGSPSGLRDMALFDAVTLDTVTRSVFLKTIGTYRDRKKYADELPEAVKEAVSRIYGRINCERINCEMDAPAIENHTTNQLTGGQA